MIDLKILKPKSLRVLDKGETPCILVSLTSYGRRVNKVYYTIVSILRQSLLPDSVVLWLDYYNWSDEKLPKSLQRLKKKGLIVKYCDDIKSYKKIIPALKEYPDSLIITCDDDEYYKRDMVRSLVEAYHRDPTKIIANRAHLITGFYDEVGKYQNWIKEVSGVSGLNVFPVGCGGTLYDPDLLYNDVCNADLFMRLSPKADDVWLYFMGLLNNTAVTVLPNDGRKCYPLDVFYQMFHKGSNLTYYNIDNGLNDVQFENVMRHYKLSVKDIIFVKQRQTTKIQKTTKCMVI